MAKSLDMPITFRTMLRFAAPTIAAQLFMSIYSTVDGLFVANLVGTDALSAVNIVMPSLMVILAVASMVSAGGRAFVAAQLGAGKQQEARENFSLVIAVSFGAALALSLAGLVAMDPLLHVMGSDDTLLDLCRAYATPLFIIMPLAMLGMVFDTFFMVEGKPGIGGILSIAGGVLNIILDYLFIALFGWGVAGAAIATGIGYSVSAVVGLVYFAVRRNGNLCLVKPVWRPNALAKISGNGASEMVMMLAGSVSTVVMNNVMMGLAGSDGVAAISIIVYVMSILSAVYYGYDYGVSALASYNFGKDDHERLRRYHSINLRVTIIAGACILGASLIASQSLTGFFARPGTHVFDLAVQGFGICSFAFLVMGVNDYASSFFTALNDGRTSAIIAFMRTFVFTLAALIIMPALWGIVGLWFALPAAELASLAVSSYYLIAKRNVYHYA